jgi:RHS repeat-associated protein
MSSGSTTNPYRFVGRLGYYFATDLARYLVRIRVYDPSTGRWMSLDPVGLSAGDANLYRYVANRPVDATDPFGLIECNCPPEQCAGLNPINDLLNDHINSLIKEAFRLGPPVNHILYDLTAVDAPLLERLPMGYILPVSVVELWIDQLGSDYVAAPVAPFLTRWFHAPCLKVTCEGRNYCIGADKIGHFFQQGHLLYELLQRLMEQNPRLERDMLIPIVEVVNAWTEGFSYGVGDKRIMDFLKPLRLISFYKMGFIKPSDWYEKWGGVGLPNCFLGLCAARSTADLAANMAGLTFWLQVMADPRQFDFDICRYMNPKWVEFTM